MHAGPHPAGSIVGVGALSSYHRGCEWGVAFHSSSSASASAAAVAFEVAMRAGCAFGIHGCLCLKRHASQRIIILAPATTVSSGHIPRAPCPRAITLTNMSSYQCLSSRTSARTPRPDIVGPHNKRLHRGFSAMQAGRNPTILPPGNKHLVLWCVWVLLDAAVWPSWFCCGATPRQRLCRFPSHNATADAT